MISAFCLTDLSGLRGSTRKHLTTASRRYRELTIHSGLLMALFFVRSRSLPNDPTLTQTVLSTAQI
jgi:hypothetical protein